MVRFPLNTRVTRVLGLAVLLLSGTLGRDFPRYQDMSINAYSALANNWSSLIIYNDGLKTGWQDWSWDTTIDFTANAVVHTGNHSISARYDAAWAGLSLRSTVPVDTSTYTAIDFWIYGGIGGAEIDVYTQPSGIHHRPRWQMDSHIRAPEQPGQPRCDSTCELARTYRGNTGDFLY